MKNQLTIILRAWKMLQPFHVWFYINTFLAFFLAGISVAITYFASQVLSHISANSNAVTLGFILMFSFELIWTLVNHIKNKNETKHLDQDVAQHLQKYSLEKILALTPAQHIEEHSALKQQIIARGESAIETIIKTFTSDFLPNISYLLIAIGALTWRSPLIGLVTTLVCIIIILWISYFMKSYRPLVKKNRDNWNEQGKIRTEAFTHLLLIKNLGKESRFIEKYINSRQSYADFDRQVNYTSIKHRSLRSGFISSADNLVFLLAITLTLTYHINLGALFLVYSLIGRVFWSITGLSNALRDLPLRTLEAEKYFEAVDMTPSFTETGDTDVDLQQDIIIKNLTFSYPKGNHPVFKNISFVIEKGKVTAFVGASGSGKSTIIKLLLRTYSYMEGSIAIGYTKITSIDATYLRSKIGYVEQHVDLLDDTIKENILIGVKNGEEAIAEKNLEVIAQKTRISEFYHRLGDKKFDTFVGERGVKLSGGERQRIGIARAIIKNPEILIFDEATSSLDTENEKYVMDAIAEVSKGKTTIIIAHRLSTVRDADKIIVMDKGTIVGEGTHDELMQSNEVYQNLVAHQM